MPRTPQANQRIREEQKMKILNAARQVFARKGWTATMADIAETAKVSQGLAYRYFASKEAIYLELVQRAMQLEPLDKTLDISGTPTERIRSLLTKVLDVRSNRIEFYQISAQILRDESMPEELRNTLRSQAQKFRAALKHLIVEGQTAGEVAPGDPEQLVIAVLACINGLSSMGIRGGEKVVEHFPDAEIVMRLLKP